MPSSLHLYELDYHYNQPQRTTELISHTFSLINQFGEKSFAPLEQYIARFRVDHVDHGQNLYQKLSRSTYSDQIKNGLNALSITDNGDKLHDYFMGTFTPNAKEIKEIKNMISNDNQYVFDIEDNAADDILYNSNFESIVNSAMHFSQDHRKHEFMSICSVFLEQLGTDKTNKLKEIINNGEFKLEKLVDKIKSLSIISFGVHKDKDKLEYATAESGLPDAMFFNPEYKSYENLKLTTVAATTDKGTDVEKHSMLRHTVASLATLKELKNMLHDTSFNTAYTEILKIKHHFDNNDQDFIADDFSKNLFLSVDDIDSSIIGETIITKDQWNNHLNPLFESIITHDGKLLDFSLKYNNSLSKEGSPHQTESLFSDAYAKHLGYDNWASYIKKKSDKNELLNSLKGIGYLKGDDPRLITKDDLRKLARDLKLEGMDTFFVGSAAFSDTKDKPVYYKSNNTDLNPVELRLGINIAAYAAEYSGHLGFCRIEPGAGLEFISAFNIRGNTKKGEVDGKKLTASMDKVHQFLFDEYMLKPLDGLQDNLAKENDYILDNVGKFKSSFYESIKHIIKTENSSINSAFQQYAKELNIIIPKEFDAEELIKKENIIIKKGYHGIQCYEKDIELLYVTAQLNMTDKKLEMADINKALRYISANKEDLLLKLEKDIIEIAREIKNKDPDFDGFLKEVEDYNLVIDTKKKLKDNKIDNNGIKVSDDLNNLFNKSTKIPKTTQVTSKNKKPKKD